MDDKKEKIQIEIENTTVDLGEDLIHTPTTLPAVKKSEKKLEEEMEQASILMGEKLFEDAKKIYRKILVRHPENNLAKEKLSEIQDLEIKDLLSHSHVRKTFTNSSDDEIKTQILENLDKDLKLNLEKQDIKPVPNLFKDVASLENYRKSVMKVVLDLSPNDRLDIGIAHFEMGLYEVAMSIFESVVRYENYKNAGLYLLALSLIAQGKAIEAILKIEPIVRDITLSEKEKTDFLYLMGYGFEKMSDRAKSREFYRRVFILNPKYREVAEKLK